MKRLISIFIFILSGCASVSVVPEQEAGYYAVGNSMLIRDAVICKSNRPGYASAIGFELPDYELIQQPPRVTPAKGCQMHDMAYEVTIVKGENITIEEFRIFDAVFPMAYPNLHALGRYERKNGISVIFYYRLGAAKNPRNLIWRKRGDNTGA
ncbi:MAG: hypothetical protein AB2551_00265 [Candidatus Thiodiazotropha sp.]